MIIHVVQKEETINSIADKYHISATRLMQDNDILPRQNLVVGHIDTEKV